MSKRALGFGLATAILLVSLALAMLPRLSPSFDAWQAGLPLRLTELLSPGALSAGHGKFGANCSVCHQRAFRAVADAACTKCHERTGMHATVNAVHESPVKVRCADCHPTHRGKAAAMRDGSSQCIACHKKIGKAVADVRDFAADHPPFHLAVPVGGKPLRVRQDEIEMPDENCGLKFSHQVHLNKQGVSSPDGQTVMTCRDCHKPETSGNGFAAMNMKTTCQQSRCHVLFFAGPIGGAVPHASEREVMGKLRDFYAGQLADAATASGAECRPGMKTENSVKRTLACADDLARKQAASALLNETDGCVLCHTLSETDKKNFPWKVDPVRIGHDWQPKAVFAHARHDAMPCTECHDKADSKSSRDISFPRIEKCRECHAGTSGAPGKVVSGCAGCHPFHRRAVKPF